MAEDLVAGAGGTVPALELELLLALKDASPRPLADTEQRLRVLPADFLLCQHQTRDAVARCRVVQASGKRGHTQLPVRGQSQSNFNEETEWCSALTFYTERCCVLTFQTEWCSALTFYTERCCVLTFQTDWCSALTFYTEWCSVLTFQTEWCNVLMFQTEWCSALTFYTEWCRVLTFQTEW